MQKGNLRNLEKTDLLTIIYEQQKEIESLKNDIKKAEKQLKELTIVIKEADSIEDTSLKQNNMFVDTVNNDRLSKDTKQITNEEKLKSTVKDETNIIYNNKCENKASCAMETDVTVQIHEVYEKTNNSKVTDTEVKNSQTVTKDKASNMLIPINTDLTIIMPKFLKKFRNRKKIRLAIVYTISLLIMAFSFAQIYVLDKQKTKTVELTTAFQGYIVSNIQDNVNDDEEIEGINGKYTVDFEGLKDINPSTKGWIRVNGVGIDFPVVQANDNKYYLRHSFDKSFNFCGWIFADYKNKFDGTDRNIVIYGHNMRDGTMFSNMTNILSPEWYENTENRYVTFITENGETTYEVFSIYQIEVEDYYIQTNFDSNDEYQNFLNTIKSRSIKDYGANVTNDDKILTLSTCGKNNNSRVVLHAKEI